MISVFALSWLSCGTVFSDFLKSHWHNQFAFIADFEANVFSGVAKCRSFCAMLSRFSCVLLCDPMDCNPPGSSVHGDSPGRNTGVGCQALLQRIFQTQGINPGLRHCRQILDCLSYQGSPRILEWVAYPFSRGSSRPRNRTGVSCIVGRFFTNWATREALIQALL